MTLPTSASHPVFGHDYDPNALSVDEAGRRILDAMGPPDGLE